MESSRSAKVDTLAGMLSGICGKICDHPLDTLRVNLQAKMKARAARNAAKNMGATATTSSSSPGTIAKSVAAAAASSSSSSSNNTAFPSAPEQQPKKRRVKAKANKVVEATASSATSSSNNNSKKKITSRARPLPPVTARRCATDIFKRDGIKGFYRGIASPLLGAAFESSIAFTIFNRSMCTLSSSLTPPAAAASSSSSSSLSTPCPPAMSHVVLSGMLAGIGTAAILIPSEVIKIKMQLPPRRNPYTSTLDCVVRTAQRDGIRAFGRGGLATLAREVPGNAAWFGTYEMCLRSVFAPPAHAASSSPTATARGQLPWYAVPVSGAAAGLSYTLAFYPADVIKTYSVTDRSFAKLSLPDALKQLYRSGGLRALYTGVGVAAARQIPSNAAIFTTYELVVGTLSGSKTEKSL